MPLACQQKMPPSRIKFHLPHGHDKISKPYASNSCNLASPMTGAAKSPPVIHRIITGNNRFSVKDHEPISIFTTRPDTLYGVTYIALAPQHPLVRELAEKNPALANFAEECKNIKVAEADMATMEKRGMPLGITAHHPLTD